LPSSSNWDEFLYRQDLHDGQYPSPGGVGMVAFDADILRLSWFFHDYPVDTLN
jgi:hypothetical protein